MSPCLASSGTAAEWQLVHTDRLPRHAFDRLIAFGRAGERIGEGILAELVSLRNALTPTGSLLVVLSPGDLPDDLHDLVARAGFTRVRELPPVAAHVSTLELKR